MSTTADAAPRTEENRVYTTWLLLVFTLVATFGFVDRIIVQILVQPIKAELHVSDRAMGFLGGLTFAALYVLLSIPIARLAERKNRIAITSISAALWSLATAASGFANNFSQLVAARVAVGIGEAGGTPATNSIIADHFPRQRRASAMAIYSLAVPLGALLGGTVGGYIAKHWGWRAAFRVIGIPGLILAGLQWLTIREPARGKNDPETDVGATPPPFFAVLRRFRERPSLVNIVCGATISTVAGYGVSFFLSAYLTRHFGLDYSQAGFLTGLISSVPAALSIMAGGFLSDWAARRGAHWYALIPALGTALCAPLYMSAFKADTWMIATAFLAVAALCQYSYIPAAAAITQNMMEPRMRASATAITGLIYALVGQGLGPLLVGALSDSLQRSHYAGDFASACRAGGAASAACAQAEATGLQMALVIWALLYLWSAVHFALGARSLGRDLSKASG